MEHRPVEAEGHPFSHTLGCSTVAGHMGGIGGREPKVSALGNSLSNSERRTTHGKQQKVLKDHTELGLNCMFQNPTLPVHRSQRTSPSLILKHLSCDGKADFVGDTQRDCQAVLSLIELKV